MVKILEMKDPELTDYQKESITSSLLSKKYIVDCPQILRLEPRLADIALLTLRQRLKKL